MLYCPVASLFFQGKPPLMWGNSGGNRELQEGVAPHNMPLTDTAVRAVKPHVRARKLFDGRRALLGNQPRRRKMVALEVPVCRQGKADLTWRLPGHQSEIGP